MSVWAEDNIVVTNMKYESWNYKPLYKVFRQKDSNGNLKHIKNTKPRNDGWLANCYRLGEHGSREVVIRKYERLIKSKLYNDEYFREKFIEFRNEVLNKVDNGEVVKLGCWCSPKPCHADVIKELIINF